MANRSHEKTLGPPMRRTALTKFAPAVSALLILAIALPIVAVPAPAKAQTKCIAELAAFLGISFGTTAGGVLGSVAGLYVPTFDVVNKTAFDITAASTAGLKSKSCADEIMTAVAKLAINLVRDMVLRWIVTGRFEGPVFSASYSLDLKKSVENAARTFLGELSGINFCAGISPPPRAFLALGRDFTLQCQFSGDLRSFRSGRVFTFAQLVESEQTSNEYWNVAIAALDQKLRLEALAAESFRAEYAAGQGFLGLRDPATGRVVTPGSAVARLVMKQVIEQPIEQGTVAHTTQEAIVVIIDTAIRVLIERGLATAFGPSS